MATNKTTRPKPMILGKFLVEEIRFYRDVLTLVVSSEKGYFSVMLDSPGKATASLFWLYTESHTGKHLGVFNLDELAEFFEELFARSEERI